MVIIHNHIIIRYHHCTVFSPQYFFVTSSHSVRFNININPFLNCTLWFIAWLRLDEKKVQLRTVCLIAFGVC